MVEHYMMVVKKEDMEKVLGFFKRNDVINADGLDLTMGVFGSAQNIDNFNLYLDKSEDSNYKSVGRDFNENITLDNDEESLKLIVNDDDFYDPSDALVSVDLSNIEKIQNNIEYYYFNSHFYNDFNSDADDNYKNPAHYKHGKYDLISHLADILTEEETRGFLKGNIFKYVDRYQDKNGIEDLEKAREYTHRLEEFEKKVNGEDNEFIQ